MQKVLTQLDQVLQKYTPDPFVIAALITFFVFALACLLTPSTPPQVIEAWGKGFWKLLGFTLQMVMILLGGFIVASSRPIKALITGICSKIRSPSWAVIVATLATSIASWFNWGFGLVVGAFIAVELGKHVKGANFRLLVASSYSGFLLWHAGLSGSIPLVVATPGNFSEEWIGRTISVKETLFSNFNLIALAGLVVLLPLTNLLLFKSMPDEDARINDVALEDKPKTADHAALDHHWWIPIGLVLMASIYLFILFKGEKFQLDLNQMNFIFLFLGLALHLKARSFLSSVNEAAGKVGPILIQYPLYAGIMGIMKDTGLAKTMSAGFVELASKETLNLFVFYSAGVVNLFVPSGGGQWAVQAPIVAEAAKALEADISTTIMAVAWGDAWTNLAQPFWALPLLAIAGLGAKDVLGFTLTTLFVSGAYLSALLLIF